MSKKFLKASLLAAASLISLSAAEAHTTSVGYSLDGPGAVTFWYGTYHLPAEASYTEGSFHLVGQDVTYDQTVSFDKLVYTKPTGLIDGTTNFYTDGTQLVGTLSRPSDNPDAWQGVSFTNLTAGTYDFTYIPITIPTDTWNPRDSVILSNHVTLSAADLGGGTPDPGPPPPPPVIDASKGAFTQDDAAANAAHVTFDGGVFAPTMMSTLGQGVTLNTAGGTVDSSQGDVILAGTVDGAGGLTKLGTGTLVLAGANTYAGGTLIQGGAVLGDTNSLQGKITNNASLVFDQSADGAFNGAIDGSGVLTKDGAGELTLAAGTNTSTGGTLLLDGTLKIGGQDALGSGAVTATGGTLKLDYSGTLAQDVVIPQGALTIDTQTNQVVSPGAYSGAGGLTKVGAGLLVLNGASTLTGATTVQAGELSVNGALGGSVVTVQQGAVISGDGTVGGLIVKTNATAAPGETVAVSGADRRGVSARAATLEGSAGQSRAANTATGSIGKLTATTFVVFERGSTYALNVDATGAADRIDATGTATLQGGVVQVLAANGDYRPVTTYTILSAAGGVSGQFENVVSDLAFLSPELAYGANAVTLTLVRNDQTFASAAATPNQHAVGTAIDKAFGFGTGVYDSLVRGTATDARAAFDQMSGEIHADVLATAVADGDTVRESLLDHLRAPGQAEEGRMPSVWGSAFGAWGGIRSDGNAASVDRSIGGFLMGVEAAPATGVRLGVAGGYSDTSADADARRSSSDIKTGHVWAYGVAERGAWALRGGVGYAGLRVDTDRSVGLRDLSDRLTSKADASLTQAFAEVSYRARVGAVTLEPMASLTASRLKTDSFQENGGPLALSGEGVSHDLWASDLGVSAARDFGRNDALSVHVTASWRHSLKDMDPTLDLAFKSGGPAFEVNAAPLDKDAFVADAGVDWRITEKLSASATYQGAAGKRDQEQAVKASLNYRF